MRVLLERFVDDDVDLEKDVDWEASSVLEGDGTELLSEVFFHLDVVVDRQRTFSSRHEHGGHGDLHVVIGRYKQSIPPIVRFVLRRYHVNVRQSITVVLRRDADLRACGLTDMESAASPHITLQVDINQVRPFYPVTADTKVVRRILREGQSTHNPSPGSTVHIRFSGYRNDGTVLFEDEEASMCIAIDDSMEGLEESVMKMSLHEIALCSVDPEYAIQPNTSGKDVPSEAIHFKIEMMAIDLAKPIWEMKAQEKARFAALRKEQGNRYERMGLLHRAETRYEQAIDFLQYESRENVDMGLRVVCYNNLAAIQLKEKRYSEAIQSSKEALSHDIHSIKALYRLASSLLATDRPEEALQHIAMGLRLCPTTKEEKAFMALQQRATKDMKETERKHAAVFRGIFSK